MDDDFDRERHSEHPFFNEWFGVRLTRECPFEKEARTFDLLGATETAKAIRKIFCTKGQHDDITKK